MTQQISMIYNSEQWNKFIQSIRRNNQNSIQEVILPQNNIQQVNDLGIYNDKLYRLDKDKGDKVPQNIQFNIQNKGFFNNYNSNLSFNLRFRIDELPMYDKDAGHFMFKFYSIDNTGNKILCDSLNEIMIYKIVIYDNYLCLMFDVQGNYQGDAQRFYETILIRLWKIPPSPQAYLDNVLLQKINKNNQPYNHYYKDIYRKQCINNQLLQQEITNFMQNQYANVNATQEMNMTYVDDKSDIEQYSMYGSSQKMSNIQVLAEYTAERKTLETIYYDYQVSIPLVYLHPFFQLAYNTPMELLNDQISMILNFNIPIFSACFAYQKKWTDDLMDPDITIEDDLDVVLESMSDMKIILYKDSVMQYNTIDQSKDGIYYLIYRNSEYAQNFSFNKCDNIVLQNVIPKLNSLDMIQISMFDRKHYIPLQDKDGIYYTKQINNMDYYLGYSSLYNDQFYINHVGLYKSGGYIGDVQLVNLNSNVNIVGDSSDTKIKYISFGDIQISIDDKNIIPYTYQKLEDIYKTNLSLYDIMDNKFSPNMSWSYPYYLKFWNTYIWKFDQKYGTKTKLQQPQFKGMTVSEAKSNIFFHLYDYNCNGQPPTQLQYQNYDPLTHGQSFYNCITSILDKSQSWIDTPVFIEFIYFFSSLLMIGGGDLIQIDEQEAAHLIKNVPFYNETDYKIAQSIPLMQNIMKQEMTDSIIQEVLNKVKGEEIGQQKSAVEQAATQITDQLKAMTPNQGQPQPQPQNAFVK